MFRKRHIWYQASGTSEICVMYHFTQTNELYKILVEQIMLGNGSDILVLLSQRARNENLRCVLTWISGFNSTAVGHFQASFDDTVMITQRV